MTAPDFNALPTPANIPRDYFAALTTLASAVRELIADVRKIEAHWNEGTGELIALVEDLLAHELPPTIVTVSGGVAEVAEGVAEIVDFDDLDAAFYDESLPLPSITLSSSSAAYIQRSNPAFWIQIEPRVEVLQ